MTKSFREAEAEYGQLMYGTDVDKEKALELIRTSLELYPSYTDSINLDISEELVENAKEKGIRGSIITGDKDGSYENQKEMIIDELERFGFKDIVSKLYYRKRTLTSAQYISLLNTYSDHRALPTDIKNSFELDMKNAIEEIGGQINIYDTIDLYLGRK